MTCTAADELAIRGLVARYCDAVCRRDPQAWVATWADDCTWDLGGGRVVRGREAVLELWTSATARYPWVAQLAPTGTVELTGDTTRGAWILYRTDPCKRRVRLRGRRRRGPRSARRRAAGRPPAPRRG